MIKGIMGIRGTQKANVIWRSFFFFNSSLTSDPKTSYNYASLQLCTEKKKNLVKHYGSQQFANIIDNKLC